MIEEKSLEALGHFLRTERERRGLTRRDLALKTRIPLDQVESIEEGRLSTLPPVFAKGFLRSYANELALDADAILDEYRQLSGGKSEDVNNLTPRYVEMNTGSCVVPGLKFLLLILVVAAGLAVAYFISPDFRRLASSAMPFLPRMENAAQDAGQEAGRDGGQDEGPAGAVNAAESAAPQVAAPTAAPAAPAAAENPAPAVRPQAAAPVPAGGTLVLNCLKDTWAQISVDGRKPDFVSFKAGQSQAWTSAKSLVVVTGNGAGLAAIWNGQALGPLSGDERPVEAGFPKN